MATQDKQQEYLDSCIFKSHKTTEHAARYEQCCQLLPYVFNAVLYRRCNKLIDPCIDYEERTFANVDVQFGTIDKLITTAAACNSRLFKLSTNEVIAFEHVDLQHMIETGHRVYSHEMIDINDFSFIEIVPVDHELGDFYKHKYAAILTSDDAFNIDLIAKKFKVDVDSIYMSGNLLICDIPITCNILWNFYSSKIANYKPQMLPVETILGIRYITNKINVKVVKRRSKSGGINIIETMAETCVSSIYYGTGVYTESKSMSSIVINSNGANATILNNSTMTVPVSYDKAGICSINDKNCLSMIGQIANIIESDHNFSNEMTHFEMKEAIQNMGLNIHADNNIRGIAAKLGYKKIKNGYKRSSNK